jgi:hypothetical protein
MSARDSLRLHAVRSRHLLIAAVATAIVRQPAMAISAFDSGNNSARGAEE